MEQLPLKDIHLPEALGWWPPAPGWWLVAVSLLLIAIAAYAIYKHLKRQTALKTAGRLLTAINHDNQDSLQQLIALSALLRRVAISTAPRENVAGLSGEAWLAYLDQPFPDAPFSQGVGRCLANAQYRQTAPDGVQMDQVIELCRRWLKLQKTQRQSTPFWRRIRAGKGA